MVTQRHVPARRPNSARWPVPSGIWLRRMRRLAKDEAVRLAERAARVLEGAARAEVGDPSGVRSPRQRGRCGRA